MNKNERRGYLILAILFGIISVIAFAVPTLKTATFWVVYVFTAVAYGAQILVWKNSLGKEKTLKSKFMGLPIVTVGVVYAVIQTIAFAVFLFAPLLPTWSAIVVCMIVTGISAVCIIATDAGCSEIKATDIKVREKIFFIKELQAEVEIIAEQETDTDIKKSLLQLVEKIRFSDPVSNEQLEALENKMADKVKALKSVGDKTIAITELEALLNERNIKCKNMK